MDTGCIGHPSATTGGTPSGPRFGRSTGRESVAKIDILEGYPEPSRPRHYDYFAHLGGQQWGNGVSTAADFDTAFHVYEMEWRPNVLIARLDGVEQGRINISFPDTHKLFIIMNMAVGVWWNNTPPDGTTPDRPSMDVDWVGVWPL